MTMERKRRPLTLEESVSVSGPHGFDGDWASWTKVQFSSLTAKNLLRDGLKIEDLLHGEKWPQKEDA